MVGIYHIKDLDGWTSAAIMKRKYPDIKLIGYDHGMSFDYDLTDEDVIIADIALPDDKMIEVSYNAKSMLWVDHHLSNLINDNEYLKFYMNKFVDVVVVNGRGAACLLLWKKLFPNEAVPDAVQLASDMDVFNRSDKDYWENDVQPFILGLMTFCNGIRSYPHELLDDDSYSRSLINMGRPILKYQTKLNASIARRSAYTTTFEGLNAICINGQPHSSLVFGNTYDIEKHDVMLMYHYSGTTWEYSIYTQREDIDCSVLAKKHGGGGHKQASGFSKPINILINK